MSLAYIIHANFHLKEVKIDIEFLNILIVEELLSTQEKLEETACVPQSTRKQYSEITYHKKSKG